LLCFKYSKKYQTNFVKVKFIKDVILNCKRCFYPSAQKTSDVSQTSNVWENQQSFTINPLFRSGKQKQKRVNKGLFNLCKNTSDVLQTSDAWENQQSFTINPLFRSGKQKQKRANKEQFNLCTKDIGCFANIRCLEISQGTDLKCVLKKEAQHCVGLRRIDIVLQFWNSPNFRLFYSKRFE